MTKANRQIAELRRNIGALGTPNLGAIDEFTRVNTRYTFLTGQRDDILKAKRELTGIIADVTALLAQYGVNVLDISQTVLQEYFTMIMLVDAAQCTVPFADLARTLDEAGTQRGLQIRAQREDIFNAMHRI